MTQSPVLHPRSGTSLLRKLYVLILWPLERSYRDFDGTLISCHDATFIAIIKVLSLRKTSFDTTYGSSSILDGLVLVAWRQPIAAASNTCCCHFRKNSNRNCNLCTSTAPLKIQAQGTRLFTSALSSRKGHLIKSTFTHSFIHSFSLFL